MESVDVIKNAVKNGKIVTGSNAVMKLLKTGKLSSVFYASNCPSVTVKDLRYYSGISGISVDAFSGNSAELGRMCGKPFKITVLGIEK